MNNKSCKYPKGCNTIGIDLSRLRGATGPTGPAGETGPTGPTGPFLSSYLEANASTQVVPVNDSVVFDIEDDYIDIVGTAISVSPDGKTFTLNEPGLYHVEWDLYLIDAQPVTIVGMLEDGSESSSVSAFANGNYSSGALIYVSDSEVPYTVSLNNFGTQQLNIAEHDSYENTAGSIRILKFADGPSI